MKASILRTLATLSLSAALAPVSMRAEGPIHITVPFDFTVGAKSLAAGEYQVNQQAPHVLAIRSVNGDLAMAIMTNPADPSAAPGKATFTFNKYGDRYFLSQISDHGHGWGLSKSSAEKELIAKRASPQPVQVPADEQ
jgi:hypothetical protein